MYLAALRFSSAALAKYRRGCGVCPLFKNRADRASGLHHLPDQALNSPENAQKATHNHLSPSHYDENIKQIAFVTNRGEPALSNFAILPDLCQESANSPTRLPVRLAFQNQDGS